MEGLNKLLAERTGVPGGTGSNGKETIAENMKKLKAESCLPKADC
jgi:hypothetical protein